MKKSGVALNFSLILRSLIGLVLSAACTPQNRTSEVKAPTPIPTTCEFKGQTKEANEKLCALFPNGVSDVSITTTLEAVTIGLGNPDPASEALLVEAVYRGKPGGSDWSPLELNPLISSELFSQTNKASPEKVKGQVRCVKSCENLQFGFKFNGVDVVINERADVQEIFKIDVTPGKSSKESSAGLVEKLRALTQLEIRKIDSKELKLSNLIVEILASGDERVQMKFDSDGNKARFGRPKVLVGENMSGDWRSLKALSRELIEDEDDADTGNNTTASNDQAVLWTFATDDDVTIKMTTLSRHADEHTKKKLTKAVEKARKKEEKNK